MTEEIKVLPKPVVVEEEPELMSDADMLAADDIEYKTIPTWKIPDKKNPGQMKQGYHRIRSLSADDFITWQEANEGPAKRVAGLRIIIKSVVDKDGKTTWNDKMLEVLKKKSHKITDGIVEEILLLNGLRVKGRDSKEKND